MGSTGEIDFYEEMPNAIFSLFLIMGVFQLIVYSLKDIDTENFEDRASIQETSISLNESDNYFLSVFRSTLVVIYLIAILVVIAFSSAIFFHRIELDNYLLEIKNLVIAQFVTIFLACLLWLLAKQWLRELISWGLLSISVLGGIEIVSHFLAYPFFHWIQIAELLLSSLALLVIPTTGFLVFHYLYKSRYE